VQGGTKLRDLDEVVEVSRLQAGVLPVVHEGQQLLRSVGQFGLLAQASNDADADQRDSGAATLGGEGRELGEILNAQLFVRHPAAQAEPKGSRQEPGT
jgi:hypothetical protein